MSTGGKKNDLAAYLFHQGTNYRAYEYMGSHASGQKTVFRVWAPNADSVCLTGDFCGWSDPGEPMKRITDGGIWEIKIPTQRFSEDRIRYKYRIEKGGISHLKADPYAFSSETLRRTASMVCDIKGYEWHDSGWMRYRRKTMSPHGGVMYDCPINIYELHLGSWRTRDGKTTSEGENYLTYGEIADELIPYVKRMGYTHVELMPVMEHPFDGSWGYQCTGYFASTSRFGRPKDFMAFVDRLHQSGIGVILDWVPAHFPKDEHGLYEFDGQPLYEYQGRDRIEQESWGTRCFDVGRNEVECFLVSSAMFWLGVYHADGLRIDAVASMLYLDYDRRPGEWVPNVNGDNKNLEAIAFFQKLNGTIAAAYPDVIIAAEESTSWAALTKPTSEGGLGFTMKWNMGWANDMYDYVAEDPLFRRYKHDKLTFSLMYAFSERYILPVSHDEVVHGKRSLLDKMWGDYDRKFAGFRAFMMHMFAHPGKKMTFMGCEYGPFREWDYENQLEWFMLDYEPHRRLQQFCADLNDLYLSSPALWRDDFGWDGFEWLLADRAEDNVIAYRRYGGEDETLAAVINFSGVSRAGYEIPVRTGRDTAAEEDEKDGVGRAWRVVFDSDSVKYGGSGPDDESGRLCIEKDGVISVDIPPLSALYLKPEPYAGENTVSVKRKPRGSKRKNK
ncbi:MAG: 1,4-alpha-glucan branching protein GlgB [Clostridiales bacterium]|nr:1,4-alpha-glucan branching protein GlgB [Clostridiales bacterium]